MGTQNTHRSRAGSGLAAMPVLEAFEKAVTPDCCPLCSLEARSEEAALKRLLGEDLMDPGFRSRLARTGLCRHHVQRLLAGRDRLGTALVLLELVRHGRRQLSGVAGEGSETRTAGPIPETGVYQDCLVCAEVREAMARYARTVAALYRDDAAFRQRLAGHDGICLPHAALLVHQSSAELPPALRPAFRQAVVNRLAGGLERLEAELAWFVQKFDYRYREADWKGTENAPDRAAARLWGRSPGVRPHRTVGQ